MTPDSIRHNLDFIACCCKPVAHPGNPHLMAVYTRGMPGEMFHDLQQALLDVGLRYHLQSSPQGQLLCFDKQAYELLQTQPQGARNRDAIAQYAAAE